MAAGAAVNPTQGPPPGVTLAPPLPGPPPGVQLAPPLQAASPAASAAAPVAAPAAAQPTPPASAWARLKSAVANNVDANLNTPSVDVPVLGELNDLGRGIVKGGMQTVGGLLKLGANIAGDLGGKTNVQDFLDTHPGASQADAINAVNPAEGVAPYQSETHKSHTAAMMNTAKWFSDHANTQGFWEGLGSTGESIGEMMGGEGLLKLAPELGAGEKVATLSEKLKATQKVAQILSDNPKLARLVALGMRTAHAAAAAGGASAAQTFVKTGGDASATEEAGALGAAGGAVLSPVLEGAGALVRHLTPEVESIAGREVPILRSQVTRTAADGTPIRPSALQEIAATRGNSPGVAGQQEAAAARTVQQEAQGVLSRELAATNEARAAADAAAPQSSGSSAAAAGEVGSTSAPAEPGAATSSTDTSDPALAAGPQTATATPIAGRLGDGETGLSTVPNGSAEDTSLPGLGTGEQNEGLSIPGAGENAASAESPIAGELGDGRTPTTSTDTSAPGLGAGDAERYKLPPVDIQGAVRNTHDFGDAADHLHEAGKAVYDRLNEVTGGQWQAADQRIQALQKKYQQAVGPDRNAIGIDLQRANKQMDKLFASPKTGISSDDLSQAKRMWRSGYILRDLHNALEPAYAIDADFARKTGAYRGFNGSMALQRFRTQLRTHPDLRPLLGSDSADNLQRIFHYNITTAGRRRFGEGAGAVARWVSEHGDTGAGAAGAGLGSVLGGKGGAAAGGFASEGVYQALKLVLHKVAADPQVGRNLLYAIDGGARPEKYGPLIGRMILQGAKKYGVPVAAGSIARQ